MTAVGLAPQPEALDDDAVKALEAACRALPLQRLVGNGMDYADAVAVHAMAQQRVPWVTAACWLGDLNLARARRAEAAGRVATARSFYHFGAAAYRFAQSALVADSNLKLDVYERALRAFSHAARLEAPVYEKLAFGYEGGTLSGWLMLPAASRRPPPVVVIFGGADGWREEYHSGARYLLERGIAAFLFDGPGQGEARILGHMFLAAPVERAYCAAVSALIADARVSDRIGIWGNSLGGTFAARTASIDRRIAACCVNGGTSQPSAALVTFPRFIERLRAMTALTETNAVVDIIDGLALTKSDNHIEAALLVTHGALDPLFPIADARRLFDDAPSSDKEIAVWPDGDHCIYNHSHEKHAVIADWFQDRLHAAHAHGE